MPPASSTSPGLGWLGARVYDPAGRGFLTVDPLDPVPGAGWAGNPYSYAGNDPLHALDPTGLRPVTDAELAAYAASNNGALAAAGDWVTDNWEYLAGGAMVIAGGVLIATGFGGPVGMTLISAGADTIIQKATTGEVNWGQVAISGAFGAFGGTGVARSLGANTLLKQRIIGGMVSGTASGATGGAYSYATGPGPHTPGGFVRATAFGGGTGLVTGGATGAFGHGVDAAAMRYLPRTQVLPETTVAQRGRELLGNPGDTVVLGRQPDTAVAQGWDDHVVLNTDDWTPELNDEFVRGAMDYQRPIYLASEPEGNLVHDRGPARRPADGVRHRARHPRPGWLHEVGRLPGGPVTELRPRRPRQTHPPGDQPRAAWLADVERSLAGEPDAWVEAVGSEGLTQDRSWVLLAWVEDAASQLVPRAAPRPRGLPRRSRCRCSRRARSTVAT